MGIDTDFDQKIALITGAGGSIGFAIAKKLATFGVIPCLHVRNEEKLSRSELNSEAFPKGYRIFSADFNAYDDLDYLYEAFTSEFKNIDFLVHCAGAIYLGEVLEMPIDDLDRLFNVNVRAPLYLTQLFIRSLIKNQGQIVFINSSVINQSNWLNNGAYAATKLALKAVTDSIRNEVNSKGVRVLGIYPGRTSSQMQKYVHSFEKKKYNPRKLLQPDDIADVVVSSLRLPRTAEVTDISIRPNKIS